MDLENAGMSLKADVLVGIAVLNYSLGNIESSWFARPPMTFDYEARRRTTLDRRFQKERGLKCSKIQINDANILQWRHMGLMAPEITDVSTAF